MLGRLVNYADIFQGSPQPIEQYLHGISRQMLLNTAVYLLGFRGFRSYSEMLPHLFGPHNQEFVNDLAAILYQLGNQDRTPVSLVSDVAKLRFYELIFKRPDEPQTQTEADMEINIVKALVVLNTQLDDEYGTSQANTPPLPGVEDLVRYILIHIHAGYDVDQGGAEEVIVAQMYKFILLFQFMEATVECQALLAEFLTFFDCKTWQEYAQRLFRLVKAANEMLANPGWTTLTVEAGADFERHCAFLDHFTLAEGTVLIQKDFFSVRAYPLYKVNEGEYVIVYPRFVVELLHKGLFFRLQRMNDDATPRLIVAKKGNKGQDWGSFYKKSFSEEALLTPALNAALSQRGLALSGKAIEDSEKLRKQGNGEPDYYFRSGKRIMLFESKDININKDVKTGDKFAEFAEAVRAKFYRPSTHQRTMNDKLSGTAILQLFHNIRRILGFDGGWPIDAGYTAKNLIFYPIVVVHDRSFRMPGLNVLANSWFQQELVFQRQNGMVGGVINPLVIIDIDTLLAYQDHFARKNNRLILWEAIDAYYSYIKGDLSTRKPRKLNEYEVKAVVWADAERQALSFADFLSKYAGGQLRLAPLAETQNAVLRTFLQSDEYTQS